MSCVVTYNSANDWEYINKGSSNYITQPASQSMSTFVEIRLLHVELYFLYGCVTPVGLDYINDIITLGNKDRVVLIQKS